MHGEPWGGVLAAGAHVRTVRICRILASHAAHLAGQILHEGGRHGCRRCRPARCPPAKRRSVTTVWFPTRRGGGCRKPPTKRGKQKSGRVGCHQLTFGRVRQIRGHPVPSDPAPASRTPQVCLLGGGLPGGVLPGTLV